MPATPPASVRSTRLFAFLTPVAIMIGVVVLLLLPNLVMHAGPGAFLAPVASGLDHHAASQSAAAGMGSPIVR